MSKIIFRLLLPFFVFVGVFILLQRFLKPDSFGKYGHYRANSIKDTKMRTHYFKGEKKCIECHQDIYGNFWIRLFMVSHVGAAAGNLV